MVVAGFAFYRMQTPRPRTESAPVPAVVPTIPRAIQSEPGVTHRNDRVASAPWSIHIVKVDRTRQDLAFYAPLATGTVLGVNLISEQARDIPPAMGRARHVPQAMLERRLSIVNGWHSSGWHHVG